MGNRPPSSVRHSSYFVVYYSWQLKPHNKGKKKFKVFFRIGRVLQGLDCEKENKLIIHLYTVFIELIGRKEGKKCDFSLDI